MHVNKNKQNYTKLITNKKFLLFFFLFVLCNFTYASFFGQLLYVIDSKVVVVVVGGGLVILLVVVVVVVVVQFA